MKFTLVIFFAFGNGMMPSVLPGFDSFGSKEECEQVGYNAINAKAFVKETYPQKPIIGFMCIKK